MSQRSLQSWKTLFYVNETVVSEKIWKSDLFHNKKIAPLHYRFRLLYFIRNKNLQHYGVFIWKYGFMNQRMLVQYSLVFYDVLRKNEVAKPNAEFNKFLSSWIKDKSTIGVFIVNFEHIPHLC